MKFLSFLVLALVCVSVQAAEFDGRAVFGTAPGHDVDSAVKRAVKEKKKVLLFGFDPKEGGSYPGYDINFFMDLGETKKLVKDNFIVVVLERGHKDLQRYPNPGSPEKAYYVLISAEGKSLASGPAGINGNSSLNMVKQWLAQP